MKKTITARLNIMSDIVEEDGGTVTVTNCQPAKCMMKELEKKKKRKNGVRRKTQVHHMLLRSSHRRRDGQQKRRMGGMVSL